MNQGQEATCSQDKCNEHISYWLPQINELSDQLRLFNEKYVSALNEKQESRQGLKELSMLRAPDLPAESLLHHAYAIRDCLYIAIVEWEQVLKDLLAIKYTGG